MSQTELVRVILAVICLLLGVLLFRLSNTYKAKAFLSKSMCYSGILWFVTGALFAYISDMKQSIVIGVVVFILSGICICFGFMKDAK